MKSVRTLITICLLLTAATLFAQTENHQLMTVKIPVSFWIQDHSLPAGEYNIFTVLRAGNPHFQHRRAVLCGSEHPAELCQFAR